jgi:hypothetical protein
MQTTAKMPSSPQCFLGRRVARELAGDRAVVHDEDAIGQEQDLFEVAGGEQHGASRRRSGAHGFVDVVARAHVDAARGLIEQEHARLDRQPSSEDRLLLVAAREHLHAPRGIGRTQPQPRDHAVDEVPFAPVVDESRARAARQPRHRHVRPDGVEREEPVSRAILRDDRQSTGHALGDGACERVPIDRDVPGFVPQSRNRLEQFGPPRTDQACQPDDLAAPDRERGRLPAGVGTDQPFDDQSFGRAVERRSCRRRGQVATDHESFDGGAVHRLAFERSGHASIAQHERAVGDPQHLVKVVRDVDDGHAAAAQVVEHGEEAFGLARAQARGRFIEDQDARVRAERLRDLDELTLRDGQAAAGRRWIEVEPNAREPARSLGMHGARVEPAEAVVFAAQEDRPGQVEVLGKVEFLVHERDAGQGRVGHAAQAHVVGVAVLRNGLERTRARLQHARKDLQERALACAVLAHDREDFTCADLEID